MAMRAPRTGSPSRRTCDEPWRVATGPAAVFGAAALAVLVGIWTWRGQRGRAEWPVAGVGRAARTLGVTCLAASTGGRYVVLRARRLFASAENRERLESDFQMRTAEDVTERLGHMKGALMKVGQIMGYLDETVPPPLRAALTRLQQEAPPMAPELAASVIEQELGARPESAFSVWDERPLAAASIGQVHRAITREALAVAVKVQYPGVATAIKSDLENVRLVFIAMHSLFPSLDVGEVSNELRTRVQEELDYVNEAANQRLFAGYYAGHPFIQVPQVLDRYSSQRVLTTELKVGVPLSETTTWSQRERNLIGETIFRFVFRSLYRLRAINGDPHPGNYLCRRGGRVSFVDFGLVRRFDVQDVDAFGDIVRTLVLDPNPREFRRVTEEVGLLLPGAPVDDTEVAGYFGQLYDPVMTGGMHTVHPEYVSRLVRGLFNVRGDHARVIAHVSLPPPFVIVQRIMLGLYAVLAQLRATADWRAVAEELWPFTDTPPSTPLGHREAAWLASRRHRSSERGTE